MEIEQDEEASWVCNPHTVAYFANMLTYIPKPVSYDAAVDVGMSLHSLGWGEPAFKLWAYWYEGSPEALSTSGLSRDGLAEKWVSFHSDRDVKRTAQSLDYEATAGGWDALKFQADWQAEHPETAAAATTAAPAATTAGGLPLMTDKNFEPEVTIQWGNTVVDEAITWVWENHIPQKMVTLLVGEPGGGKNHVACSIAATISIGGLYPDGTRAKQGNVLIWSGEEGIANVLSPRVRLAGADMTRVGFIDGFRKTKDLKPRPFDPSTDMAILEKKVRSVPGGVALVIIDPIVSAMPSGSDSYKNAEVRRGLQPIVDLAGATGAAVLGITHFNKSNPGLSPLARVCGSLAFGAVTRACLAVAENVSGKGPERVLVRVRVSNGKPGGGFGFAIKPGVLPNRPDIKNIAEVIWDKEPLAGTAKDLLFEAEGGNSDTRGKPKLAQAKQFLMNALACGERKGLEVEEEADAECIALITLKRAKKLLRVVHRREDNPDGTVKCSWWSLPPVENSPEVKARKMTEQAPSDDAADRKKLADVLAEIEAERAGRMH